MSKLERMIFKAMKIVNKLNEELEFLESKKEKSISDIKRIRKIKVLLELIDGKTVLQCSTKWDLPISTVYRWNKEIKEGKISINTGGRNHRLNREQREEISKLILEKPKAYGYGLDFWTGKVLKDFIKKRFNIDIKERTAQKILYDNYVFPNEYTFEQFNKLINEYEKSSEVNLWYFISFLVWRKSEPKVEEGEICIGRRNILYYFMALNKKENKILVYEVVDEAKVTYDDFTVFVKDWINDYMDDRKNIIVMAKTSQNMRMAVDIALKKIDGMKLNRNIEILFIPMKERPTNNCIWKLNPLYLLKEDILNIIKENKKDSWTRVRSNVDKKITDMIEKQYALY
ncbi:helix-turn-helix domain-containing protein [Caloranaerobacter azorensis]|uniref:Helix-turn-helix domain-containing protein n=1 Tax=Caloranaerobacter azorensis TaxID=116090 RepID=A0A6P1YF66_9FIRM|nr:helix-turn-helix domain-containing protein [Caloranaerobacter azorensis]QIB27940.1 helix-turn-helix domain-containing protein [Caloranaerobacter azorensis]